MRGGMLEAVCTSLNWQIKFQVKKKRPRKREWHSASSTLSHKEAITSSFSIPEEKGNKN